MGHIDLKFQKSDAYVSEVDLKDRTERNLVDNIKLIKEVKSRRSSHNPSVPLKLAAIDKNRQTDFSNVSRNESNYIGDVTPEFLKALGKPHDWMNSTHDIKSKDDTHNNTYKNYMRGKTETSE